MAGDAALWESPGLGRKSAAVVGWAWDAPALIVRIQAGDAVRHHSKPYTAVECGPRRLDVIWAARQAALRAMEATPR